MTDREAMLAAICENPDDDTPRLIYADWLDENGRPLRAEYIRAGVTAERPIPPRGKAKRKALRKRMEAIFNIVAFDDPGEEFDTFGVDGEEVAFEPWWSRGFIEFIEFIEATWGWWEANADRLLAEHPIQEVVITTEPSLGVFRLDLAGVVRCDRWPTVKTWNVPELHLQFR